MANETETPSTLTHTQSAQDILTKLRELVQALPDYKIIVTQRRRKLNMAGNVDDDFLRNVAIMVDATPHLAISAKITGEEIREHLGFHGAYAGIGDEMILLGRGAKDTLLEARGAIGQRALNAVAIARTLTKPEDREKLMPHLDNIQKNFARGKRKIRKPAEAAPEPAAPDQVKPQGGRT
jgi:hypothetical protein